MWVPITLLFNSQVWPLHRQVIVGMTVGLPKVLSTAPSCTTLPCGELFFISLRQVVLAILALSLRSSILSLSGRDYK